MSGGLVLGWLALYCVAAPAQNYPTKPIRVVGPFAAGSGTDVMTRVLMEGVHKGLAAMSLF